MPRTGTVRPAAVPQWCSHPFCVLDTATEQRVSASRSVLLWSPAHAAVQGPITHPSQVTQRSYWKPSEVLPGVQGPADPPVRLHPHAHSMPVMPPPLYLDGLAGVQAVRCL